MAKVAFSVEDIVCHFSELEDPRSKTNLKHPLASVLVIATMAVLSGATGLTSIAEWANIKAEFLLQLLDRPNGIPQKDVFWSSVVSLETGSLSKSLCLLDRFVEGRSDVFLGSPPKSRLGGRWQDLATP